MHMQECMQLEAKLLPEELAAALSTSGLGNFTGDQAKQWTLQQWLTDLFPVSSSCPLLLLPGQHMTA